LLLRHVASTRHPWSCPPASRPWPLQDRASFLHVNSWFDAHTTWQSVGLLVADSLQEALATSAPPAPAGADAVAGRRLAAAVGGSVRNYVLAADNSSVVPQMVVRCGVSTPDALLLYLTSNVTLSKPPVPAAGIDVLRPLVLVGLAGSKVSLDFAMQVNQVSPAMRAAGVPRRRDQAFFWCRAPPARPPQQRALAGALRVLRPAPASARCRAQRRGRRPRVTPLPPPGPVRSSSSRPSRASAGVTSRWIRSS
jgi:hypothetical protein